MARGDKKGKDGMKKGQEKMARRDKKEKRVIPFLWARKSHIPTLPDKDVADRFLYRMIFFFFPVNLWHILYEGLHGLVACKAKVVVELGGVVVAVF